MRCGSFEALGESFMLNHPLLWRHISLEWRPQRHKCENLKLLENYTGNPGWKMELGRSTYRWKKTSDLLDIVSGNVDWSRVAYNRFQWGLLATT